MAHSKSKTSVTSGLSRAEQRKINGNPNTGVSLCIPKIFQNITEARIRAIFYGLRWGFIERVDMVGTKCYIHFAPGKWNMRNKEARDALTAMQNGDQVNVVYDDPWWWIIRISETPKPAEGLKKRPRPKVTFGRRKTIDIDESKVTPRSNGRKKARRARLSRKNKGRNGNDVSRQLVLNDPITARAMENSPKSAREEMREHIMTEELANTPSALRHFDEAEGEIENNNN
jgi:hypothetical protein